MADAREAHRALDALIQNDPDPDSEKVHRRHSMIRAALDERDHLRAKMERLRETLEGATAGLNSPENWHPAGVNGEMMITARRVAKIMRPVRRAVTHNAGATSG